MENFWYGKRVLVTGGDGFLATHLTSQLIKLGAVVTVTVRHKRPISSLYLINDESSTPDVEDCDLLRFDALRRICDRQQVDTIFHLAASAIVSDAANSPMSTIENNVVGTVNILEVARINKIPRVIIASTDKSYGDHANDAQEGLPYQEQYALRGLDVYSASKACADVLAQTYSYQFKIPVLITRSCNMYGPGDLNFSRLIPRTIMCLMSGRPPQVNQGNDTVLREYIYIEDVVKAYLLLGEQAHTIYGEHNEHMPKSGKETYGWAAYNIGSYTKEGLNNPTQCDNIRSVTDVISVLRQKIKDVPPVIKAKPPNFIEIPDQYSDSSKIIKSGFKPEVGFEEGLDRCVAWYAKHYEYLAKIAEKYIR